MTFLPTMRSFILFFAFASGISTFQAAGEEVGIHLKPIFEIRANRIIKVDGEWRDDCPKRLKVGVRVDSDTPGSTVTLKAYFYDAGGNVVKTYDGPTPTYENVRGELKEVGLPDILPKNKDVEVLFALTPEFDSKWKSVIVVASKEGKSIARSRPAAAIDELSFPGKDNATLIRN